MKWKHDVKIERVDGIWLIRRDMRKRVEKDDEIIVNLMEAGIESDDELIKKAEDAFQGEGEGVGFRLAQFVENYGAFLAEGTKSKVFDL